MAIEVGVTGDLRYSGSALDDREFSIVRKGYDPDEVKVFLAEVEANMQELEKWAERMKARLALAEDKSDAMAEIDEAMLAVFEAKERVLAKAELQARRTEAEAEERARADAETIAAELIAKAKEEARRIVDASLAATTPVSDQTIINAARMEADRLIEAARVEVDRLMEDAQTVAGVLEEEPAAQLVIELGEAKVEMEAGEPSVIDSDAGGLFVADAEADGALRRSRYERTSAHLPSAGDDASDVFDSIRRLRKRFRDS